MQAVCAAAAAGDADALRALLVDGSPADATDTYGVTALTIASCMGHVACVELLTAHGADCNLLCSSMGPAPLHMALQEKRADIVAVLLQAAADPALEVAGRTPLQVASSAGGCDACVLLLETRLSHTETKESEPSRP